LRDFFHIFAHISARIFRKILS